MTPSIFITGSSGNVGREVIRTFPDRSRLRAGSTQPDRLRQQVEPEVECVYFDFQKPESYVPALQGITSLFLVRPPAISDVAQYIAPVIDAAKSAGVGHIVFLSLVGVENNRVVPHYRIEQHILQSGLEYTFLRAGFFMQNLSTTHRDDIRLRSEIAVPAGHSKTSFIDARDIGAIGARALNDRQHRNCAYNLTGSEALDYYEVALIMSAVLGRPIRYTNPSVPRFLQKQLSQGKPLSFALVMTALYTMTRFGAAELVSPDASLLLGREPIRFQQFAEDHVELWRND